MTTSTRLKFIDGLRGLAAMAVVIYHLRLAVDEFSPNFAGLLDPIFRYGYLGVDVFFVISGIVISYSVSKFKPSIQFLGRFALRRSIRLDPPYWSIIVAEIVLIALATRYFADQVSVGIPDWQQVLAHLIYAQDLLRQGNILSVFWTLCYEIQFYLFFVLGALALDKLSLDGHARRIVVAAVFVTSLFVFFFLPENPVFGLFIDRWYQFFVGVLAMRCLAERKISIDFVVAVTAILACALLSDSGLDNGVSAILIAILVVWAGLAGKMGAWLSGTSIQFLGAISYSLYLVHLVVGWRIAKFIGVISDDTNPWPIFLFSIVSSIFAAWLLYHFIERPSLNMAKTIQLDRTIRESLADGRIRRQV